MDLNQSLINNVDQYSGSHIKVDRIVRWIWAQRLIRYFDQDILSANLIHSIVDVAQCSGSVPWIWPSIVDLGLYSGPGVV